VGGTSSPPSWDQAAGPYVRWSGRFISPLIVREFYGPNPANVFLLFLRAPPFPPPCGTSFSLSGFSKEGQNVTLFKHQTGKCRGPVPSQKKHLLLLSPMKWDDKGGTPLLSPLTRMILESKIRTFPLPPDAFFLPHIEVVVMGSLNPSLPPPLPSGRGRTIFGEALSPHKTPPQKQNNPQTPPPKKKTPPKKTPHPQQNPPQKTQTPPQKKTFLLIKQSGNRPPSVK